MHFWLELSWKLSDDLNRSVKSFSMLILALPKLSCGCEGSHTAASYGWVCAQTRFPLETFHPLALYLSFSPCLSHLCLSFLFSYLRLSLFPFLAFIFNLSVLSFFLCFVPGSLSFSFASSVTRWPNQTLAKIIWGTCPKRCRRIYC